MISIHSDIGEFLQYVLNHASIDCTQLLPLSALLHVITNNDITESNTVLLATKELMHPLLYSYSTGLQNIINTSSTDSANLCQYRSVVTEYCLDKLCCELQPKLLPTDDHGITLNSRQQHCKQLQQLLDHLWSSCCTPLYDRDHHQ